MMYNYPFYSSQRRYSRYYNYQTQKSDYINKIKKNAEPFIPLSEDKVDVFEEKKLNDDFMFELFGIKLFYDDILILFLIYFLYKEGVTDLYLYIALFLLFIS